MNSTSTAKSSSPPRTNLLPPPALFSTRIVLNAPLNNGLTISQDALKNYSNTDIAKSPDQSPDSAHHGGGKKSNGGRWTEAEQKLFLEAYNLYGKDWKKIQNYVGTRTSTQARSHAQKYFAKLRKSRGYPAATGPLLSPVCQKVMVSALAEDAASATQASAPFITPEKNEGKPFEVKVKRFLCYNNSENGLEPVRKTKPEPITPFVAQETGSESASTAKGVPRVTTMDPLVGEIDNNNSSPETPSQSAEFKEFNPDAFEEEPAKPHGVTIIALESEFPHELGDCEVPDSSALPDIRMLL